MILKGYRAFVAGDLDAIERMLDPEVEWVGAGEAVAVADRADVLEVLQTRLDEQYHVTVDRCIGVGDEVVVSMRFSRTEATLTTGPTPPGGQTREALEAWGITDVDSLIDSGAAFQA